MLPVIAKSFEPFRDLWLTASDWQTWQREWLDGPMADLDPDEVDKGFTNAVRAMAKAGKTFKGQPVGAIAVGAKEEMEAFRPLLPVVVALRNPGMRDRHWEALSSDLGFEVKVDANFTLRYATEQLRLHDPKLLEKVQKVCERAMKEFAIEKSLNDMLAGWDGQEFEVMPYRSTGSSVRHRDTSRSSPQDDLRNASSAAALSTHNFSMPRCRTAPASPLSPSGHQSLGRGQHAARRSHCAHAAVFLLAVQGPLRGAHRRLGAQAPPCAGGDHRMARLPAQLDVPAAHF